MAVRCNLMACTDELQYILKFQLEFNYNAYVVQLFESLLEGGVPDASHHPKYHDKKQLRMELVLDLISELSQSKDLKQNFKITSNEQKTTSLIDFDLILGVKQEI